MEKFDALLRHFESAITEGVLRTGDRLPAERQLAERFRISRASVREALQQLRARGWINSKRGGGHYVSAPMEQDLAQPLLAILGHHPEAHFDLLEFRHSIEGDCAYNAALRANNVDLAALTTAFSVLERAFSSDDLELLAKADAAFHLAIAEASHNLIFLHLVKSLLSVFQSNMLSSINCMFESEHARQALMNQHAAIYDAIMNRQPSMAKAAAQSHVHYVDEQLKMLYQQSQEESHREQRSLRRQTLNDSYYSFKKGQ